MKVQPLLSPNPSVYLARLRTGPLDPFLWAFVLAVSPALHAPIIPLLSSSIDPNVKTTPKPPFHHELYAYAQIAVFMLSFELNL